MKKENNYFEYRNNVLHCGNIPVDKIVTGTDTPVYIYSREFFKDRFEEFTNAFRDIDHLICYSVKANFNLSVIRSFTSLGSGVDVNSEGELFRALKAGADPRKIILTGVGKTEEEIRLGIFHNLLMIKAESLQEVELINKVAGRLNQVTNVALRVNPDVNPETHPYISTGLAENKFGVEKDEALEIFRNRKSFKNINFIGIDMHIGSQITTVDPYVEAIEKLSEVYRILSDEGLKLSHFDIGGGMGVAYQDEEVFSLSDFSKALVPLLKKIECKIIFEPGRYLTANGGILVTKVLYNKAGTKKNFIIVDAAMNDLLRPSIYNAYHHIQHVKLKKDELVKADIVGPVCESGDFIGKERTIEKCYPGELLSVMSAGAYGITMSSNYNARRRPAEVMVDRDSYFVVRGRESYPHLLFDEEEKLI